MDEYYTSLLCIPDPLLLPLVRRTCLADAVDNERLPNDAQREETLAGRLYPEEICGGVTAKARVEAAYLLPERDARLHTMERVHGKGLQEIVFAGESTAA